MRAGDAWIEKLAMFISRRCNLYLVSSEDVTIVVDFHWFTDCHLEAIFNMNASRVRLRFPTTIDGKDVRLTTASRRQLIIPRVRRSTFGARAFAIAGPTVWNSLPDSLRDPAVGPDQFLRDLKTHLFE